MKFWAPKFRTHLGDILVPTGAFPFVTFYKNNSLSPHVNSLGEIVKAE